MMYQNSWPWQSLKYRQQLKDGALMDTVVAKGYGNNKDIEHHENENDEIRKED
jgi:hypothetical protein